MFPQPVSKTFFWLFCSLINIQIKHLNTNLKYVLFIHRPVENFPLPPVINFSYCHSANRINASAPKKWCSMNLIFSKRSRSPWAGGPAAHERGRALRAAARRTGPQGEKDQCPYSRQYRLIIVLSRSRPEFWRYPKLCQPCDETVLYQGRRGARHSWLTPQACPQCP